MDLVAHCGDVNRGSYINSLVLTDIASGWTEAAPIIVRQGNLVVETLDRIRTVCRSLFARWTWTTGPSSSTTL
jgi:hypothetical protein